ncbi:MAG: MATE family efflux transporter [Erysipelotrichaceae bacterium]|nr:MATE family efflux transporter [Erysipelotrichaceae bacterium]
MARDNKINLTEGVIWKQLLLFVWPIMVANVFQQLYNVTNSMIVGNFIDTKALSAVSATNSITQLAQFFFHGVATAAGILVSHYYGAGKKDKVKSTIETALLTSLIVGAAFTIFGELFTPLLLKISNVSPDIYQDAEAYLRVLVLENVPVLLYNVSFFIMRSFGDSKHPLYYLVFSCLVNIILGVIFVRVFHMGVIGTALATVLSQLIVDYFALALLFKLDSDIRIDLRHIQLDTHTVIRMAQLGIPASVQNMLLAISNMVVQSYVNLFPYVAIAGIGVANKVSFWVQIPMQSISTIGTNFVGQNLGAGKYDRVKNGIRLCNLIATIITVITSLLVFIFAEFFIGLFDRNPEVIRYGAAMTRWTVFSFIPLTWSHIYNGCCRGAGNVKIPMIIAVMTQCVAKYVFVKVGMANSLNINIIYLSSTVAFTLAGIFATLYFHLSSWTREAHLR